ncbi:oxidoreductase [Rhodobacter veldkampii DSM 11550]|uniref:Oxidoreductase n=1 Tax=Phaeovulum veldkampii DSM 11550 TaxID=1185920 RepID=A0A2T4JAI8_9RHOB|nr:Gfo/Idh/MocA family oxidoreductase [Phaeovulum veldkampii]MBK5947009.1 oxidoreductase [Phaeovulum veldkampii DSM 11550]PTE14926.1 oxidoreductase [Phaeovulum veldkampii DSM 11550]TDQ55599.1 putative dehydrogenase [Phaeovulum veldkampii DSM 11550]
MPEAVNWGILGASQFAQARMAPAIHAACGARLAALASADPAKAAGFRDFCPDLRVHSSYDALLADPAIEAVYIPLPNHLHVDWTLKGLAAGKHVLCEKPVALRAPEIDRLIAVREATGLLVAEAFMIVHHPQWQRVRDWIGAAEIGALTHVDVAFTFDNPDPANIRNRPETGGGSVPDIGVYAYGAVRWATGAEPVRLTAQLRRENGVDVFAQVWGDFDGPGGGFSYSALTSTRLFPRQEVVFQGSRGLIRLTAPFNAGVFAEARIEMIRAGHATLVETFPGVNQYVRQVEAFCAALRGGAPFAWRLEDARGTQEMIDRVLASSN